MSGLRTLPELTGEPSQGSRRLFRLFHRNPFAAGRAFQVLLTTDHHSPSLEVHGDHVAHLSVLKSGKPVWPVSVHHQ